ncbi:hypothetical protein V5799_033361 [Amblyomma americanum]|uniref:Uncharacterized protein n=1 Tax=Amblyomma americanum TaxID=6943 RepID=A0AAQ4DNJ0_AMBAM
MAWLKSLASSGFGFSVEAAIVMSGSSLLLGLLAVVAPLCGAHVKDECIIVAPNALRLGTRETVVALVSGQSQHVSISLGNHPSGRHTFFNTTLVVFPNKAATVEVSVGPGDLPQWSLAGGQRWVTLAVTCGSLWSRHAILRVREDSGEIHFLQTDKPIYHPGSTVYIRSIALDGTLAPSPAPCKLEIRNPQDVVMEENPCRPDGDIMLSHRYSLPKRALLGEWKLVMRYGDQAGCFNC